MGSEMCIRDRSIFVSTQMQTEIAQAVSANMGGILDITEKTTTGAGYIANAMNQLTETAGHLKRSVARYSSKPCEVR